MIDEIGQIRQIDGERVPPTDCRRMRAERHVESSWTARSRDLYDGVLRWAIAVENLAAEEGLSAEGYLLRGSEADRWLWAEVERHRNRYPASAGPSAVVEVGFPLDPGPRSWSPTGEVSSLLGLAAEPLARLADLTDEQVGAGFLGEAVAIVEATAYRDAVRVGMAALRKDGRVRWRTFEILEDLATRCSSHDPHMATCVDILLDELMHRVVR